MRLIKTTGGIPTPYTVRQLRADNPNVSFTKDFPPSQLVNYDAAIVQPTVEPAYDEATQKLEEGTPTLVSPGVWQQVWNVVAKTQEEQDAYANKQADQAARQAIKQDTPVKNLLLATPTQINNYIDTNVTDLASAKEVLKILARAVSAVGREAFRD